MKRDDVDIAGAIEVGSGVLTFVPFEGRASITQGSVPNGFTLTDAELDLVTTTNKIVVGDANMGDVIIVEPISPVNVTTLEIISGATIGDSNTIATTDYWVITSNTLSFEVYLDRSSTVGTIWGLDEFVVTIYKNNDFTADPFEVLSVTSDEIVTSPETTVTPIPVPSALLLGGLGTVLLGIRKRRNR